MCCTGQCHYEVNDYTNGGTKCLKPNLKSCPMDEEVCPSCESDDCTCAEDEELDRADYLYDCAKDEGRI